MMKRSLRWLLVLALVAIIGVWALRVLVPALAPSAPGRPAFRDESLFYRLLPGLARARDLRALNKGNIRFYGRVVDQFGQPVSGATIKAGIEYFKPLNMWPVFKDVTNVSDTGGYFAIVGQEGFRLFVTPKLAGYVLACTNTDFNFSAMSPPIHRADSNRPVVLKMWKLQGPEPLMQIEQRYRLPFTNSPIHVDLLSARAVPDGGDLVFSFTRPEGLVDERNRQPWDVVIRAESGGVMLREFQEYLLAMEAPDEGYEPQLRRHFDLAEGNYQLSWQFCVLFRSRSGMVHGKVSASLSINQAPEQPLYIEFKGVANTNGSRNWEASAPKELLP